MLGGLGLSFSIDPPHIDESEPESLPDRAAVIAWVRQLAIDKAAAVAQRYTSDTWILAADTIVVLGARVFGKPADEAQAEAMLGELQGRRHTVMTAVSLRRGGPADAEVWAEVAQTEVTFFPCSAAEIAAYVATGESLDKAGAYAAQGIGALIIEKLDGCYFNVVGLPISVVGRLLRRAGFDLWSAATASMER